jgi:hypothetical protein
MMKPIIVLLVLFFLILISHSNQQNNAKDFSDRYKEFEIIMPADYKATYYNPEVIDTVCLTTEYEPYASGQIPSDTNPVYISGKYYASLFIVL